MMGMIVIIMRACAGSACIGTSAAALKSAGYAALGQVMGKSSARILTALLPGVGSVVRAGVAASVTEAIGWAVLDNLEEGSGV